MTFFAIVIIFFAFALRFSVHRELPSRRFVAVSTWVLTLFAIYATLSADHPATLLYRALLMTVTVYSWKHMLQYSPQTINFADLHRTIKRIAETLRKGQISGILERKIRVIKRKTLATIDIWIGDEPDATSGNQTTANAKGSTDATTDETTLSGQESGGGFFGGRRRSKSFNRKYKSYGKSGFPSILTLLMIFLLLALVALALLGHYFPAEYTRLLRSLGL